MTPFERSGATTTEILAKYMRGELDAAGAARELRAAFPRGSENEYVIWPRGPWSETLLQAKRAELAAVMNELQFGQAVPRDLPERAFPFRAAEFAEKAEVARRRTLRGLVPFVIVALGLLVPGIFLSGRYLVPFLLTFCFVFSGVSFIMGIREERRTRAEGLVCPSCGVDLIGTKRWEGRVELEVLKTGKCPECRTRLFLPDDPTAAPAGGR